MAKYKLLQFAELETFTNVRHHVQRSKDVEDFELRGKWQNDFFQNQHPVVLELGCGKGEYTLSMARSFKDKNFIGIDLKGNRLWTGAKTALQEQLHHVGFLRMRIDNITTAFNTHEVDEIWITFPDPQPQQGRVKKRLTSPVFLRRYQQILKPGAMIHLKTDSALLYDYTMEILEQCNCNIHLQTQDLYKESPGFLGPHHDLLISTKTHYEKKFYAQGHSIHYVRFSLKQGMIE